MKRKILTLVAVLVLAFPLLGYADVVFELGNTFNGPDPAGTPPWLVATFADAGVNTVTLTLTSNLIDGNFIGGGHTQFGWGFNYNPEMDLSALSITANSGNSISTYISKGEDAFKADGTGGFYDILFGWSDSVSGRFLTGSLTYTLTATGLDATDFNFLSTGGTDSAHSAAHVQGLAGNPSSDWIDDNNNNEVPEPATLLLLGAGLIGVFVFYRIRRMA